MLNLSEIKPGRFVSIHTKRPMKTRAKIQDLVEKESEYVVRLGVEYDNIKSVQNKRESGELPEENAGLKPNFVWEQYPVILKNLKTGELYLRCSKVSNNPNRIDKPKTKYFINGKEVEKTDVEPLCLAVEFPKEPKSNDVFDIKVSSIIEVK